MSLTVMPVVHSVHRNRSMGMLGDTLATNRRQGDQTSRRRFWATHGTNVHRLGRCRITQRGTVPG
eukprot:3195956-Pyramimonas_sp.AAC.3